MSKLHNFAIFKHSNIVSTGLGLSVKMRSPKKLKRECQNHPSPSPRSAVSPIFMREGPPLSGRVPPFQALSFQAMYFSRVTCCVFQPANQSPVLRTPFNGQNHFFGVKTSFSVFLLHKRKKRQRKK